MKFPCYNALLAFVEEQHHDWKGFTMSYGNTFETRNVVYDSKPDYDGNYRTPLVIIPLEDHTNEPI